MIGDGILTLVESGVMTNQKNYLCGKMVATFALGSKKAVVKKPAHGRLFPRATILI